MDARREFIKRFRFSFLILYFVFFLFGLFYFIGSFRIVQLNIWIFFFWIFILYLYNRQGYRNYNHFKQCTIVIYLCVITIPLTYYAIIIANTLSTSDWAFTFVSGPSPIGASSCTSTSGISQYYNPNGFFQGIPTPSALITRCYFPSVRWADSNGITSIVGYSQDLVTKDGGLYANDIPEDYPNNAIGLTEGLYKGFSKVTGIHLCPGTDAVLNDNQFIGKGRAICAQCSSIIAPLSDYYYCDEPFGELWFCYLCPGYYSSDPIDEHSWKMLSFWFFSWDCIFILSLFI